MNWKKIAARTLAVSAILVVLVVVGGYLYLKSSGFHRFAMRKIVEETDKATGGRAQIGGFDFELSTLTAHLYNVVIRGNEPPGAPPLLDIRKLTVGIKIQSVLHRKISLSELLIEHPVVHLSVNRNGKSNIPSAPRSQSGSHTNIFALAAERLLLSDGEAYYKDRKTLVNADVHDLRTEVRFDPPATRYVGSISYDDGDFQYGAYASLPHSFSADFSATPTLFSMKSAVLKVASSTVTLHASLTDYSDPKISGSYDIRLHAGDFATLHPSVKTAGDVVLTGAIRYQHAGSQAVLRNLVVEGRIACSNLSAARAGAHIDLHGLQGKYQLANGALQATDIQAGVFGGRLNANVEVKNLDTTATTRLQGDLHNISLQEVQRASGRRELDGVTIAGIIDGTASASWTGSVSNLHGRSDLTVRANAIPTRGGFSTEVPIDGAIHAAYDGPKNILGLHQTTLRIPSTRLTAEGQLSKRSSLQIRAASSNLQQFAAVVSAFRPVAPGLPSVSGSATLNARVQGSVQDPRIAGNVSAQNLKVRGSQWKRADVSIEADSSRVVLADGSLVSLEGGEASFAANIGLTHSAYAPSNPVKANLSLRKMSVADLQHLANLQYPVSGELSASVSVSGSQVNPSGSGSLEIAKAHVYGEPFQTLGLKFHSADGSIVSQATFATHAGSATADVMYTPKTKAYSLRVKAPEIVLQKLRIVQEKNLAVNGTLAVSASGAGTLADPQLTATLQSPQLEVRQKPINGLKAQLNIAQNRATFTLDSEIAQAAVRVRGNTSLADGYETEASLDTGVIPLGVLLATYVSTVPEGFQGQTELHATLKGPLKDRSKLEAHLTIPTLSANYESLQIGATGPIRADYSHSVLTLQPTELRGTDTSIRVQGSLPLAGSAAPSLTAQGSINARILRIISPDMRSSGTVTLDIHTAASGARPGLQGQVRLENISLATPAAPLGIDKLSGTLDLNNDRVQISHLTGEVGGGQVSAGGSIRYRPSLQFGLAIQGNSIRLRYPEGLRSMLDPSLTWTGTREASTLAGRVLINGLSFTPDFDLASFADQFSSNAAVPAPPGFADTVGLQIAVQSAGNLSATSSQVSIEGSADLRVIGTAADPVIVGRADLGSGELFYRNVRYQIQNGIITFDDPNSTRPVLNVAVTTTIEQYNLTLTLRGSLDHLTTSYVSDPPLSTADVINLIARGKTSSELAASSQSTDSMIASQVAGQVTGGLQKLAGISSLQIDPLLGGSNQNPSARVAIQQRVTKNFLFTFSTDVSQPGQEVIQGDYQINKRWSVSVERDQAGGIAIDGRYHTRF